MDLSALGTTLPAGLADGEREMGEKFRAAALSITTLYKSSLANTKQAYHVGYQSCLKDVLSTLQSSIGAGQTAEQVLAHAMDWLEARETAMNAFATDEETEPVPPTASRRPPAAVRRNRSYREVDAMSRRRSPMQSPAPEESSRYQPAMATPRPAAAAGVQSTPAYSLASSSPSVAVRPIAGPARTSRSPLRYRHDSSGNVHPPQSSFNPSLPSDTPTLGVATVVTVPVPSMGFKRPITEIEMGGQTNATPVASSRHGGVTGTPTPTSMSASNRIRAAKRRNLGPGSTREDEGGDKDRDRRKGGGNGKRGHGNGHGGQGVVG